jgi:hypothetical protein
MNLRAAALLLTASLTGCATATQAATTTSLSLPSSAPSHPLATATLYTSPDGGIYENPDSLQVTMLVRSPDGDLGSMAPSLQSALAALRAQGAFTFIAIRITNLGKAGSDPQLNGVQIASDYAPAAAASGPLHHYYHPMFPLALLSPHASDASCSVHLDPGQTSVAVLVYPPITATTSIVWGVYKQFALRIAFGGGVSGGVAGMVATVCAPPQPQAPS